MRKILTLLLLILAVIPPAGAENAARKAEVTAVIQDGLPAHSIRIPGADGQEIYIRELFTSFIVRNGWAEVLLQDHVFYDHLEGLTAAAMDVTLSPFLVADDGYPEPLAPVTYTIEIPASPIRVIAPETLRTEVAAPTYVIRLAVQPGSLVTVNGRDVSDLVNFRTGRLAVSVPVEPVGDNAVTVTCRSRYCRETRLELILYREPGEVPLDPAADTSTYTSLAHLQIRCTTLPGAQVSILSPHSDLDITDLNTTGAFTFYANFERIGDNMISVEAAYPGRKTARIDFPVCYVPSVDVYTRKAWQMNEESYAELVSNIEVRAARQQVYVIMGTAAHIVSEEPQIAVFYTSADGKDCPVLVQNCTRKPWTEGQDYRLYADVYGAYDGMPWLCARFVYDH